MDIDTSACNFIQTPRYCTSIGGTGGQWDLIGHNAIYSPASTTFRIYLTSLSSLTSSTMASYASTYTWNINWVGMYN
jgi:hypothetical protein